MTLVPVGDALERIACANEAGLIEVTADELEADRTAICGEAPGQRHGRASRHVERTRKAEQSRDEGGVLAEGRHLGEGWRRECLRRHREEINRLEQKADGATKRLPTKHDLLIVHAGLLPAEIEQARERRAVLVLARRISVPVRDGHLHAAEREP